MLPDNEPDPVHEMKTKWENRGVFWVECPVCGRLVILLGGEPAIYEEGDQYAKHRWGTGGVQNMGAAIVQ